MAISATTDHETILELSRPSPGPAINRFLTSLVRAQGDSSENGGPGKWR